jgi:hypothetical protein
MSMIDAYYGDYGMAEASARKRRSATSIANQQAAILGQKRGTRDIADLTRKLTEGFRPQMASYGKRGLAGPGVSSGIQRKGLERYAADMERGISDQTQGLQDEQNRIAMSEATSQADLEDYLAQLRLQKQRDIISSATALKQYAAY